MSNSVNNKKFSLEYLKSRLNYNPETGIFTWKFKNNNTKGNKIFNTKFGGKIAGGKVSDGYLAIGVNGKLIKTHRLAYLFMTGEWPNDEIDHINGNPSDNRWKNLRAVSRWENNRNSKIQKNNTSGLRGVSWYKNYKKWCVRIHDNNGKRINLGYFDNFNEAVKVRKEFEIKYGYHENHGRK